VTTFVQLSAQDGTRCLGEKQCFAMSPARAYQGRSMCLCSTHHETCIDLSWHAVKADAKSTAMLAFVDGRAKLQYAALSQRDAFSAGMEKSNDRGSI